MSEFKALTARQTVLGIYIKNFIKNTQKLKKAGEFTVADFRNRHTLLKAYWDEFFKNDLLLSEHMTTEATHKYYAEEAVEVPLAFTLALSWLDERIVDIQGLPYTPNSPTLAPVTNNNARFEKIKLPRFDGQQRSWDSFRDKFSALIIQDVSIPAIFKFHHLLGCLDGEAAKQLSGIEVVGLKFEDAWKHLCDTYDNRFLRADAHLSAILQLPIATTETSSHLNLIITTSLEGVSALKAMEVPVEHWDVMLVHVLKSKLAPETKRAWVRSIDSDPQKKDFPSFNQFKEFISKRIREASMITEPTSSSSLESSSSVKKPKPKGLSMSSVHLSQPSSINDSKTPSGNKCKYCAKVHFIAQCDQFFKLSIPERRTFVLEHNLCFNCLSLSHKTEKCFSKHRCIVCGQAHHSRLHIDTTETDLPHHSSTQEAVVAVTHLTSMEKIPVASGRGLLPTALITLQNSQGHSMSARALLDFCAEESIMSEFVVDFLGLPKIKEHVVLNGAGGNLTAVSTYRTRVIVKSPRDSSFALEINPLVLKRVSSLIPSVAVEQLEWPHLQDLQLADPHFGIPNRVDCILGSIVAGQAILPEIKRSTSHVNSPIARNTRFGWVLSGSTHSKVSPGTTLNIHLTVNSELSRAIERLWEVEEITTPVRLTPNEEKCLEHFHQHHHRDHQGRFVVRLPFSSTPNLVGTRNIALKCFQRLERRFKKDPELLTHYTAFISEYEALGHLCEASTTEEEGVYLPHHPVWKRESKKIRVVFNASQGDIHGRSLNSCLHAGPKLQLDIFMVLCRWAFFRYVFICDIVKMFRQFIVSPEDRPLQRILWRAHPSEPLRDLELCTVTYGTACAPFLANACLLELAKTADSKYHSAAQALLHHRYVDDFFSGADSVEESEQIKGNLVNLLQSAGLKLDKFATNYNSSAERIITTSEQHSTEDGSVPVLGLVWEPTHDMFHFKFQLEPTTKLTKRTILSVIARLFDPMGWIAPVIVRAKIIMQSLWLHGSDWDVPIPPLAENAWIHFYEGLSELGKISVPRWVHTNSDSAWELQGFADASERAYAAVVYVVAVRDDCRTSTILTSKTKVSPIKTLQLPRLELCAAHLLAKLIHSLRAIFIQPPKHVMCWSDSNNVLTWLSSHPSKWQTFVANRVSEIYTWLPDVTWNYVRSGENPADLASRGCSPAELRQSSIWWKGPEWLERSPTTWVTSVREIVVTQEEKRKRNSEVYLFLSVEEGEFATWIRRFSSADKVIATWAYCLRWFNLVRRKIPRCNSAFLSAAELEASRLQIVRLVQQNDFSEDLDSLKSNSQLPGSSRLKKLCPFLDNHGVMRVGGRLDNSLLSEEQKHPAILDPSSHFSQLLIRRAHKLTLHGGVAVVHSFLSQQYWLDKGRNTILRIIRQCPICLRHNARVQDQKMAPLPSERVRPSRPFTHTGLDYAGPFSLKKSPGRGSVTYKGYVAIFVCLSVKAIHLEMVSECTTSAFMAALRRFTARRGLARVIFSDNGTNFQGASTELKRLFSPESAMAQEVASQAARQGIEWRFIPPSAPHFGGLWEGNIRSVKRHLTRVLGNVKLTYEEFSTVLHQVEACLNSRPLYQMSPDGNDLSSLTPGHFLIGSSLLGIPDDKDAVNDIISMSNRWKLVQQLLNSFWHRWKGEYLCSLQKRQKWLKPQPQLKMDDLVIITNTPLPPTQWALGRVSAVHHGPDGLTRVVTVKTATSELIRPIHKLILLLPAPASLSQDS